MSTNWLLDATPAPAILVLPPDAASLDEAHAAIELWEHYSGKTLDPTQRLVVEVMMAQDADGRWAASTTGREMPRQNGKGDEVEVVELWGLVQRGEAILHTIHDAVLLATQTQERMLGVLEGHKDLRRLVKRRWKGTGQQMIEMTNGGVIWYRTRTGAGGRGVDDIDRLVVDEAQHADSEQLAAITPTLLANPNPQMNLAGTAGLEGKSAYWWTVRKRALSPDPGRFGYVGHTAETVTVSESGVVEQFAVDASDREAWHAANPVLHSGRGEGLAFFEEQFHRLGADKFAQEHLCVWAPPPDEGVERVISHEAWQSAFDPTAERGERVEYAIDASPDLKSASIAASDGRSVLILEHHPGFKWVPGKLSELVGDGTVWLDPKSDTNALQVDLKERGIRCETITAEQHAQAAGAFLGACEARDGSLLHSGQPILDAAVAGAVRRPYGDAWAWSRRNSAVDISPLVAATIARWAALNAVPAVTPGYVSAFDEEDDEW